MSLNFCERSMLTDANFQQAFQSVSCSSSFSSSSSSVAAFCKSKRLLQCMWDFSLSNLSELFFTEIKCACQQLAGSSSFWGSRLAFVRVCWCLWSSICPKSPTSWVKIRKLNFLVSVRKMVKVDTFELSNVRVKSCWRGKFLLQFYGKFNPYNYSRLCLLERRARKSQIITDDEFEFSKFKLSIETTPGSTSKFTVDLATDNVVLTSKIFDN